jgi:hypothetical protein
VRALGVASGCVVALAIALATASPAAAASPTDVMALQLTPCPEYEVLFADSYSAAEQAEALEGDFDVLLGRRADLVSPVDWSQDPYQSRSWRHWLHAVGQWIDPLFYTYREGGPNSLEALEHARDLILDWVGANPPDAVDAIEAPWSDKVTADRAPYVAYLTRAAACEGMLDDAQASLLLDSLRAHASYLVAHHAANNHGLYGDFGLALLGEYLYFLPEAQDWQTGRRGSV